MILVVNCGSSKTPKITEISAQFKPTTEISIEDFSEDSLKNIDGIILSGAPILVTEIDPTPYLNQFESLLLWDKPIFGICFGHQIIGMIHGAKAMRCDEDRDWQTIKINQQHSILEGFETEFKMMQDHCECISVPPNFDCLASSITCQNEIMIHQSKSILGVQFHPEVSEKNGMQLFENFFNKFF